MFLELNSKGLYQSSGKEKQCCCLLFPSSTKREIRQFHVVVVQRRQRNVEKSVMHVQSCCFSNQNLSLFCRSRCCRSRRCVNSLPVPPIYEIHVFMIIWKAISQQRNLFFCAVNTILFDLVCIKKCINNMM